MLTVVATLGGLATSAGAGQASAVRSCAPKPGTVARDHRDRMWHQGTVLRGCSGGEAFRIGAWHAGDAARLADGTAIWTTRSPRSGGGVDRVSAFDLESPGGKRSRWLDHVAAVPRTATTSRRSDRVVALAGTYRVAAWVTAGGRVVLAVPGHDEDAPTVEPATGETDKDPAMKLRPDGDTVLAATVPAADAAAVGRGLAIDVPFGDGDECAVGQIVSLIVPATATTPARRISWTRVIYRDDDPGC
ncbi:hypothetical protein [Patulibacter minatonensis]|uniref:hypothetical protein n=1 Tax=Patulibacter minatonensis TaxID=298163 RepID=UPI0012FCA9C0|nr:hypothetical protein [Patulibacter minatonensis]